MRRAILEAAEASEDVGRLSVAEVCRRADIHRVTFYGHWETLDEAVAEAFTEIVDALAAVEDRTLVEAESPGALSRAYLDALDLQVAELARRRRVYRRLFCPPGPSPFVRSLERSLQDRAQAAIDALRRVGVDVPGAADGTAAAYLGAGVTAAFAAFVASEDVDFTAVAARIAAQFPRWWPSAD